MWTQRELGGVHTCVTNYPPPNLLGRRSLHNYLIILCKCFGGEKKNRFGILLSAFKKWKAFNTVNAKTAAKQIFL